MSSSVPALRSSILPGVEVVQRPDGSLITREALDLQPVPVQQTIPWKKIMLIAGFIFVIGYGTWMISRSGRQRQDLAVAPVAVQPIRALGGMDGLIPPALLSLVGLVFLSKMLRGEFTGWGKILKDFAK